MSYDSTINIDYQIVAEPEEALSVNKELNLARRLVEETDVNLFLTGKAGTGKTTFLRRLCSDTDKRMVVLAPTGVAAINARGVTINSFFQFPFSPFIPGKGFATEDRIRKYVGWKTDLIKSLDLLVIDEISMVRPDMLDAIDDVLQRIRMSDRPFGGVQLLLIGDLRQLSPVVRENEWNLISQYYSSPYFFESRALKASGFMTIELSKVFRQSDDNFINILNGVRDASLTEQMLQQLNNRWRPDFDPDDEEGYIRLTTHNYRADQVNEQRLAKIDSKELIYSATVKGHFPESSFPADSTLRLKKGAQVMFVKNDVGESRRYFNGMLGVITDLTEEKIYVQPAGSSQVIEVAPVEWENTSYRLDAEGEIKQNIEGIFVQFPLRTAWAITIHKSQGLTFDKAIIDAERSFAPGQAYVALSRCKSLEGMVLGSQLNRSSIITDPAINMFEQQCRQSSPNEDFLGALRAEATRNAFYELFNFHPLRQSFIKFQRLVSEYLEPIHPELYKPYKSVAEMLSSEICGVADKFCAAAVSKFQQSGCSDEEFLKRIQNGCNYFAEKLVEIKLLIEQTPTDIDNAEGARRTEKSFVELYKLLLAKLNIMERMCKTPFSQTTYRRAKNKAILNADNSIVTKKKGFAKKRKSSQREEKIESVRVENRLNKTVAEEINKAEKKEKRDKKVKKPKGYSRFETLRFYEKGMTISQIASERKLTPNTIASHIAELIILERIRLQEVVDENDIQRFRAALHSAGSNVFADYKDKLPADIPNESLTILIALARENKL